MMVTTTAEPKLSCRVVESLDDWIPLRDPWDELLLQSPDSTPWQSWDFLTSWWRHLAKDNRLLIVVVERDGQPCLILPLQIATWKWMPGVPVHMLEPIGMIMDVNRPRFALGVPDAAALACALDEVWRRHDEWDLIRIDEKTEDHPEIALLRDFAARHDLHFRNAFSHLCPYLALDQTWESYLKKRSSRLRKNLRGARNRLESLGKVSLRSFQTALEIEDGLQVVLGLHQRSWKRKKKVEHSESESYQQFYRDWLLSQAPRGRTQILALYCDEQPVAATIAFNDGTTYYSAQIVHDANFGHCSPGTLLEAAELEHLMLEQRFAKYDFLGSFLNNKMRWTDTATRTTHVFVMQRSVRNVIIDTYYFRLKPFVKPRLLALIHRIRNLRRQ